MASATTAQLFSKSDCSFVSFKTNFPNPFVIDCKAMNVCATGMPKFLNTVESVKSRCNLEIGSLAAKWAAMALAMPKLPSAFSKSIGFTLCGIAEEPTSPGFVFCLK